MPGETQDIYQSGGRRRDVIERGPASDGGPPDLRTWRDRIATLIFIASLVLLFGVLSAIIFIQYRALHRVESQVPQAEPIDIRAPPRATAILEMDPEGRYVADELDDVATREIPETGDIPMTIEWVKQAARLLQQADLAAQRGTWAQAMENYRSAQRILPGIVNAQAHIGLCQLRLKRFAESEAIFSQLLAAETNSLPLRNNLGVALMGQGKTVEARAEFARVTEADPRYVPALRNMGLLHYQAKEMVPAAEILAQARALQPEDLDLAHMLAIAYLRSERWNEAARVLGDSAERAPDAAPIHFRLAEALSHTPDKEGSIKALKRGVQLVDARTAMRWLTRKEFDAMRDQKEFRALVEELTNAAVR